MNKSLALKKKIFLFLLLVSSFVLLLNLSYFLIYGERGIISYYKSINEKILYNDKYIELVESNELLEKKIQKLQPNTLDVDFLDELVRYKTGNIEDNEVVIVLD